MGQERADIYRWPDKTEEQTKKSTQLGNYCRRGSSENKMSLRGDCCRLVRRIPFMTQGFIHKCSSLLSCVRIFNLVPFPSRGSGESGTDAWTPQHRRGSLSVYMWETFLMCICGFAYYQLIICQDSRVHCYSLLKKLQANNTIKHIIRYEIELFDVTCKRLMTQTNNNNFSMLCTRQELQCK